MREERLTLVSFPSHPAGGSIDSDCAFEPDYAVPPLSMTEGMQHIRIMEGVSRSLPSSPLLTHQTISVRLQPVKKLTGKIPQESHALSQSSRVVTCSEKFVRKNHTVWAESGAHLSRTHFLCLQLSSPKDSAFQRSLLQRFTAPL